MEYLPESLKWLLHQLKARFDIDASVLQQSAETFQINIHQASLVILFYRSLSYPIVHVDKQLTDNTKLIHIDEDLLLSRKEVVITRIAVAAGKARKIYARHTVLLRVNKEDAMEFQRNHHLQVSLPGKYRFGLYNQGELVSIAVFSGGRKMHQQPDSYRSFELLRFCHKSGYLVIGGLSKLIHGMIRHFNPGDIMTYVDRDWSDGRNYEKIGFHPVGKTASQKFYIDHIDGTRYQGKAHTELIKSTARTSLDEYSTVINLGSIKMRYSV